MKNTPHLSFSHYRGVHSWALALLLVCLSGSLASAQSGASTTGSGANPSSSSSSSNSGSGMSDRAGAGSGSTADRASGANSSTGAHSGSGAAANGADQQTASLKRADKKFITKAAESTQKEIALSQLAAQKASNEQVRTFAQTLASEHAQLNQELIQIAQRKGVTLDTAAGYAEASADANLRSEGRDTSRATSGSGMTGTTGAGGSAHHSTNAGVASEHGAPRATGAAGTAGTPASSGVVTNQSTATGSDPASGTRMTSSGSPALGDTGVPAGVDRHYRNLSRKSGADFDREYVDLMVDAHEDDVKLFEQAAKNAQDPEVRAFASKHLSKLQGHLAQVSSLEKAASAAE